MPSICLRRCQGLHAREGYVVSSFVFCHDGEAMRTQVGGRVADLHYSTLATGPQ